MRWFRADRLGELAFDHNAIVDYALWRLRNKMAYGSIAYHLLGEYFTLAQVREVYEAVLDRALDPGQLPPAGQGHAGNRRNRRIPAGRQAPPAPPLPLHRPPRPRPRQQEHTMSSVNTAIQLITREQADDHGTAARPPPAPAAPRWPAGPGTSTSPRPCRVPAYGPGASCADVAPAVAPRQGQLPEEYQLASDAELDARIRAAKAALGDRAVVLGHFYQRDEVDRSTPTSWATPSSSPTPP